MSPRSEETNRELREQSRRRILSAALELFAERGYDGATVAQIAARAEVARGLVPYYFGTKEGLLEELLTEAMTGAFGLAAPAPDETTADERLAGLIDRVLGAAYQAVPVQRLVLCLMLQPATREVYARVETAHDATVTAFEDGIRSIFADRGAPDPALEEMLLRSVLEGVLFKLAVYPETYPLEAVRRRVHAMYDLTPAAPLLPDGPERPATRLRV
ncbi:TetR/AcrR family transcriptional regulator [Actinomadura oligospora]|uniref:TetR/AcrR family transcriptional regulator n=1 Tax=Actinomadura oligospora TaxID=111804 RepID=UPI00047BB2EF|nr:TetR/AcrR family transcriptional regulator [Actinomadura oligospora]